MTGASARPAHGSPVNTVAAPGQTLDRRRVYIFPSRAGATFAIVLFIILLGAINYDNALGYLLAFLLAGMTMIGMLYTVRNLTGLRFVEAYAQPVFAGDDAVFECIIENAAARERLALVIKQWPPKASRMARRRYARSETEFSLHAHEMGRVPVKVETQRRGWVAIERVCLHSEYPLGILRSWAYFKTGAACLVYPRAIGDLPLPLELNDADGQATSETRGYDEFAGLRDYRAGDPIRAIAWKTFARSDQLVIKRFHGQSATRVWLSWAAVESLLHLEQRLSQLTVWVLAAEREHLHYGLELPDQKIDYGHGPAHQDRCLEALALFRV